MSKVITLVMLFLSLAATAQANDGRCSYKIRGTASPEALDVLVSGMADNGYNLDEVNGKYTLEVTSTGEDVGNPRRYYKDMYSADVTLKLFNSNENLVFMSAGKTTANKFHGSITTYTSEPLAMTQAIYKISDCSAISR
jgi:hypothetical protein